MTDNHTILLVENDAGLLKLNKAIFESGGYSVVTAEDGEEALNQLELNTVKLIITDVLMPRLDGFSLCYHIRKNHAFDNLPIIIYSATYVSPEDEQLAIDIGADLYVRKPATLNYLLSVAQSVISIPRKSGARYPGVDIEKIAQQYNLRLVEKLEEKSKKLIIAREELTRNEYLYRALMENTFDSISLMDANGGLVYQSPAMERLTGYSPAEMKTMAGISLFHPDDQASVSQLFANCLAKPGMPFELTARMRHKNGHYIWIERTITNQLENENVRAVVCVFREVTGRKQAEEKLIVANRLYAFTSAINKAIVHVDCEQTLFNEACRIAVETGRFCMAFVGRANTVKKIITLEAHCNASQEDIDFFSTHNYADSGPTAQVLKNGVPFIINDFEAFSSEAGPVSYGRRRGFGSGVAMPIKKSGKTCFTFNLFSRSKGLFDNQEMNMLEEISADISFALDNFEKEALRREISGKLRQSELRLKQAQSIAHVGSWELNFLTGLCYCSEETCRIYGISPFDQVHTLEKWFSFIHPDDTEYVQRLVEEGMTSNSSIAFYHRIHRKDGAERILFAQAQFEFNANNEPISLHGVAHDITEAKKAEEALEQSEKNLRLIIDLLPQAIFARNFEGKFLFVNNHFARLYGLPPGKMVGSFLQNIIPAKSELDFFMEQDQLISGHEHAFEIPEHSFTDHAGNTRIYKTLKVPYLLPGTNEKALLGITEDITEPKRIEEERAKMVADIVQRNKDLEQFSYIVSHNLRSPVANISGLAEILQMEGLDEVDKIKLTHDIGVSVKRLDEVIMDLNYILQFKSKAARQKERVRFSDLVNDVRFNLESQIRNEDVTIQTNFAEIDEMHTVKGYLFSIFLNLISNSIKYKKANAPPVIRVSSKLSGKKIILSFKDNGLGIDLERSRNFVFGLYKRFHGHVEGKGMGLFMVKTQVESLGGHISVESEVNKGTEFTITFES